MAVSPDLAALLERLAGLAPADRDFVLGQLGEDRQARLVPLLAQAGRVELSAELKASAALAQRGDVPAGMTIRAAEALAQAARAAEATDPAPAAVPPARTGWLHRLGLGG